MAGAGCLRRAQWMGRHAGKASSLFPLGVLNAAVPVRDNWGFIIEIKVGCSMSASCPSLEGRWIDPGGEVDRPWRGGDARIRYRLRPSSASIIIQRSLSLVS